MKWYRRVNCFGYMYDFKAYGIEHAMQIAIQKLGIEWGVIGEMREDYQFGM